VALLAGAALLIAGLGVFRVWSAIHAISPRAQPADLITMVHAQTDDPGSLGWKIKHDERINVLLLGYGGPGHDGPYLTDSVMLLSIRPGSHEAIMISLPRDLWVKIPALPNNRYMMGKLNSAYAIGIDHRNYPNVRSDWKTDTGGGDLAAATVSQVTGQPIDYWVGVDFKAFRDVVNAVGGIKVDVPTTLDDPFFPAGESTGMMHIRIDAGAQQFDGERALEYARSRETTSDFDRSRRQQLIMLAVRQRVFSLNAIPRLLSLLGALQDNVRTNLRPAEMQQLASLAGRIKDQDIRRVAIRYLEPSPEWLQQQRPVRPAAARPQLWRLASLRSDGAPRPIGAGRAGPLPGAGWQPPLLAPLRHRHPGQHHDGAAPGGRLGRDAGTTRGPAGRPDPDPGRVRWPGG